MSTSNILIALNTEVSSLNRKREVFGEIIALKMEQMKRLNWAMVFLYTGIFCFLLSGLLAVLINPEGLLVQINMIAGVASSLVAIVFLISFGFRSVNIRQKHLNLPGSDFDY
jgi:polyferredoxin